MTTEQRFEQMEAQVAALELRDARRESEHRNLLETYNETIESREALLRKLDEDYTMLGKAIDDRIDELKARAAGAGGLSKEELLAGFGEMADLVAVVDQRLYRFMASTLELCRQLVEGSKETNARNTAAFDALHDRLRNLEDFLRPALEGRAKLMAVEA